jgi:hypothetical protein
MGSAPKHSQVEKMRGHSGRTPCCSDGAWHTSYNLDPLESQLHVITVDFLSYEDK